MMSSNLVRVVFFQITSATLSYDRNGNSTGKAIVTFKSAVAAAQCVKECDCVLVDDTEMVHHIYFRSLIHMNYKLD